MDNQKAHTENYTYCRVFVYGWKLAVGERFPIN